MKVAFALAFLAVAQAFIIEEPNWIRLASPEPTYVRSMLFKYGLDKPALDEEFFTFAKSLGQDDLRFAAKLRSVYDEPALMFFKDTLGDVVSYYADSGISYKALAPEVRSVFSDLLSSADSFAIAYHPEQIIDEPEHKLISGRFFQPIKDVALSRFFPLKPEPDYFAPGRSLVFRRPEISSMFPHLHYFPARYDFDEIPFAYRTPVALKYDFPVLDKADYKPLIQYSAEYPWAKASYPWVAKPHSLVDAKFPVSYSPSYYKYDLPYSAPYFRYEAPYAKFEYPYAKFEHPLSKFEHYSAKYDHPYAKYEIPFVKYELPYAKYEPVAKYNKPYSKYEIPLMREFIVVPEEHFLKSPFIKPIFVEKIHPQQAEDSIKLVKPQISHIAEKEIAIPAEVKHTVAEKPVLLDSPIVLKNVYAPTPVETISQPLEERLLNSLFTQKYAESAVPIIRDPFLETITYL